MAGCRWAEMKAHIDTRAARAVVGCYDPDTRAIVGCYCVDETTASLVWVALSFLFPFTFDGLLFCFMALAVALQSGAKTPLSAVIATRSGIAIAKAGAVEAIMVWTFISVGLHACAHAHHSESAAAKGFRFTLGVFDAATSALIALVLR